MAEASSSRHTLDDNDPSASNAEDDFEEVYKCFRCGKQIHLDPDHAPHDMHQVAREHLQECMPPEGCVSAFAMGLSHLPSLSHRSTTYLSRRGFLQAQNAASLNPLDMLIPLQPRRAWSAEDERCRRLEDDPDAYDVGPHSVTCGGCHRPIRLNATGRYYAANWNKHKMGCKNTSAVSGTGGTSMVGFRFLCVFVFGFRECFSSRNRSLTGRSRHSASASRWISAAHHLRPRRDYHLVESKILKLFFRDLNTKAVIPRAWQDTLPARTPPAGHTPLTCLDVSENLNQRPVTPLMRRVAGDPP